MLARRAQAVTALLPQLTRLRGEVQGQKIGRHNRARFDGLREVIDTINSLLIPRAWVGLDANGSFHVTYLHRENVAAKDARGPIALSFNADFVWDYTPWDRKVRCVKCRDGSIELGAVLQCEEAGASQPLTVVG